MTERTRLIFDPETGEIVARFCVASSDAALDADEIARCLVRLNRLGEGTGDDPFSWSEITQRDVVVQPRAEKWNRRTKRGRPPNTAERHRRRVSLARQRIARIVSDEELGAMLATVRPGRKDAAQVATNLDLARLVDFVTTTPTDEKIRNESIVRWHLRDCGLRVYRSSFTASEVADALGIHVRAVWRLKSKARKASHEIRRIGVPGEESSLFPRGGSDSATSRPASVLLRTSKVSHEIRKEDKSARQKRNP
jgi:hypothetical protein